jgi:entry exclusion lipoprotein TrbK
MKTVHTTLCLAAALLVACSPGPTVDDLPEATEENCLPEKVAKIDDEQARNKFEDLCVRSSTFKPSPKRGW